MKLLLIGFIAAVVMLLGCDRGLGLKPGLSGSYSGNFSVRNNALAANLLTPVDSVTVIFNHDRYQSKSDSEKQFEDAKGTYTLKADEITFRDSTIHTADFDSNRVLNGTYNYSTKGDSLLIVKQLNYVFYTYKLKRR